MTATPSFITQKQRHINAKKKRKKPFPPGFGWKDWVVPAWQLREFIEKNKHQWQAMYTPLQMTTLEKSVTVNQAEGEGWKMALAMRVSCITGKGEPAVLRRLFEYVERDVKVAKAEYADAICLSLGLHLEYDAGLIVLPGNRRLAAEMLTDAMEFTGKKLPNFEEEVERLLWIAYDVIHNPKKANELVGKAPLNVLKGDYV